MNTNLSSIHIDERDLRETFVRSSGPGGQHVNKTSTAVKLFFDVANSNSYSPAVKERILKIAGTKATDDGVVIIHAQRFRSLILNREDAQERIKEIIAKALVVAKKRTATKAGKAAHRNRLETKERHGQTKKLRVRPSID